MRPRNAILALLACSLVAALGCALAAVVPSISVADSRTVFPSTIRVLNLQFDDFKLPASAYDATVCGEPVELVTVSRASAVFRLGKRPAAAAKCPLVFLRYGSVVFQADTTVDFVARDTASTPTALDVTPAFYPQGTRTRVTVTGTNLLDAGRVVWAPAPAAAGSRVGAAGRECSELKVVDARSFTCLLPTFAEGELPAGRPIVFDVFRRNHALSSADLAAASVAAPAPMLSFDVLPVAVSAPAATFTAVAPATFGSGTEVTVSVAAPMAALLQYPWVPVLTPDAGGDAAAPAGGITVTSVAVPEAATSLSFTLTCYSCVPGVYRLALGDAGSSARAALIPTALTVTFAEPSCGFGRVSPAAIAAPALADAANPVHFSVPVTVSAAGPRGVPSVFYRATSADGAPVVVPMSGPALAPAPGRGRALLTFGPPAASTDAAVLPKAGATVTLLVTFATASGNAPLSACTLADAFQVTAPAAHGVYVSEVKPRLYFTAATPDANSTVTFTGAGLSLVTKVLVGWAGEGGAALSEPCAGVAHLASADADADVDGDGRESNADSDTVLTCRFPNSAVTAGAVTFSLWRGADSDGPVATAAAIVAAPPTVTLAPATVPAYSEAAVTVSLSATLPESAGVTLALYSADGARVAAPLQWLNAAGGTAIDALFTAPGAAYAALTVAGAAPGDKPTVLAGGGLTVTAAAGPTEATLEAVLPSELHTSHLAPQAAGAAGGPVSVTFRLVFSRFSLIAARARWVAIGPRVSEAVTNTGGTLHVRLTLPHTAAKYAVTVLDEAEAVIAHRDAAVTVSDADTKGITFWGDNDVVFVQPAAQPFVRCSFDGAPEDGVVQSLDGLVIEKTVVRASDGLQHFEITLLQPCGACAGKVLTFEFSFTSAPGELPVVLRRSFQLAPAPTVLGVWPPAGLDYSQALTRQRAGAGAERGGAAPWCLQAAVVVETVQPRYPLTLVLTPLEDTPRRALPGLSLEQPAVDPYTGTYTACIACTNCVKGYYGAGLSAAHRSAHSPAAGLTGVALKVTPRPPAPGPGPDPKPPVDPDAGGGGGLDASSIAFIVIGNLLFLAGAAWIFFKWRQRCSGRQAALEEAELDTRARTRYTAL